MGHMRIRFFMVMCAFALAGCTSAAKPNVGAASARSNTGAEVSIAKVADTSTSEPATSSKSTDPTSTDADTPTTSSLGFDGAVPSSSGWTSQSVGTLDASLGSIDTIAFAPDGRAVAFSNVERSCCSNDVRAWFRQADGQWIQIDDEKANFVSGSKGTGAFGGPGDVVWFKDRFFAIGTRGGRVEPQTPGISTTWVSLDGLTWTATEETVTSRPAGLTASIDGSTLFGVWSTDAGKVIVRSTTDGKTWTYVSSFNAGRLGVSLSPSEFATVSAGPDGKPQMVIVGSLATSATAAATDAFVATSSDGLSWTIAVLPPPPDTKGKSFVVANHIIAFDGSIEVHGHSYPDNNEDVPTETNIGWRSHDGQPFVRFEVKAGCRGTLTSIVVDQAAPETTLFAVCAAQIGPAEGDFAPISTQLVISHDGTTFEPAPSVPNEWATPSTDIDIGPVAIDSGKVVVAVGRPNTDVDRSVTLWVP
jgi:hypothetical protein